MANAYLIEGDDGLTLIDAGFPNKQVAVFAAITGLGRSTRLSLSTWFSLTATPIISAVPLPLCGKPVRGLTCTRSISLWLRAEVRFGL